MDYIISAVHHVADHGYKFLPQYRFNHRTGEWRHASRFTRFPGRRWLSNFDFERLPLPEKTGLGLWGASSEMELFSKVAAEAQRLTTASEAQVLASASSLSSAMAQEDSSLLGEEFEHLRWFVYPSEVRRDMLLSAGKLAPDAQAKSYGPGMIKPVQCRMEKESPRFQYRELICSPPVPIRSPGTALRSPALPSGPSSGSFQCRELKVQRQQERLQHQQQERLQHQQQLLSSQRLQQPTGGGPQKRPSHDQVASLSASLKRFATFGRPPQHNVPAPQTGGLGGLRRPDAVTFYRGGPRTDGGSSTGSSPANGSASMELESPPLPSEVRRYGLKMTGKTTVERRVLMPCVCLSLAWQERLRALQALMSQVRPHRIHLSSSMQQGTGG